MNYYIAQDRFGNYDLAHHGIKGQKWGVRRYQNSDGTLTAAGKRRYVKDVKRIEIGEKNTKIVNGIRSQHGRKLKKELPTDNRRSIYNKINAEHERSKEYKDAQEAWDKYSNPSARKLFKSFEDESKAENRYYSAQEASDRKYREIGQKYYRDFVEAKLKDYGLPHTKEYVDIAEEYLRKQKRQGWD